MAFLRVSYAHAAFAVLLAVLAVGAWQAGVHHGAAVIALEAVALAVAAGATHHDSHG